jgi:hypothetical protein
MCSIRKGALLKCICKESLFIVSSGRRFMHQWFARLEKGHHVAGFEYAKSATLEGEG